MTDMPGSLAAALARVQANLPEIAKGETAIVPTKTGGSYKYSYADLAAVTRVILPRLGAVGLAWMTKPTMRDGRFVLEYKLVHSSGEAETGEYPLPDRGSPQEIGSAITYARRYALCSVTGVAPDDDDDAAEATAGHRRQQQAVRPDRQAGPDPRTVRDWALRPDRTADEILSGAAKLAREHPAVLDAVLVDEHGDEDTLGAILARRADEVSGPKAAAGPAEQLAAEAEAEERRRKRMHALFNDLRIRGREERLTIASMAVGRDIATSTDLTFPAEVEAVITALETRQRQPQGANA